MDKQHDVYVDFEAKKSLKYTGDRRLVIDEHDSREEEDDNHDGQYVIKYKEIAQNAAVGESARKEEDRASG
jgi:hypothetical protein